MSLDQLLNPNTPPRRYVITGGPSAGKEAVFTELAARGIGHTEGEPAREIYRKHRERLGRHLQVGDRRAYSRDVLEAFIAEYCAHTSGLRFYNRGIPDGYGWDAGSSGLRRPTRELEEAARVYRYDAVFVLDRAGRLRHRRRRPGVGQGPRDPPRPRAHRPGLLRHRIPARSTCLLTTPARRVEHHLCANVSVPAV